MKADEQMKWTVEMNSWKEHMNTWRRRFTINQFQFVNKNLSLEDFLAQVIILNLFNLLFHCKCRRRDQRVNCERRRSLFRVRCFGSLFRFAVHFAVQFTVSVCSSFCYSICSLVCCSVHSSSRCSVHCLALGWGRTADSDAAKPARNWQH